MSEMIERVRDAIEKALHPLTEPGRTTTLRELAGGCARAAIEATREPTKAMVKAGHEATVFEDDGLNMEEYREQPAVCWRRMIDEALK